MLIRHKIGLSFLAVFLLLGTFVGLEYYQDIGEADHFARREAMAIAQTMSLNFVRLAAPSFTFSPASEAEIQQSIEDFNIRQKRDIFVVDTSQRIVADSMKEEIGTTFNQDPHDNIEQTLLDGKPRSFEEKNRMHPDGIKQLVIPLDSSSGERLGALVLEYTPLYRDIHDQIKQNAMNHLFLYAAVVSMVLVAAYAYARRLAVPLKNMRNAARQIADGKEGARIRYDAQDELGELAASFNKMAMDVTGVRKDLIAANEQLRTDIENRQKAEEALLESEQKLRALLDAIPDMILFKDVEGRHQLANRTALDAFDGPENLIGKTAEDLLPPDAAKKCRLNDEEVMSSHNLRQDEESIPDQHGGTMFIDTIRVPLYDARQNPAGLVVIVRDITEKKVAEERILASLREKEVLLREIHHRVKNNLAIVISLLRLQAGRIESEEVRNVFIESQNRIKAMALVHEKLFSEAILSKVNVESYVKKLVSDICKSLMVNMNQVKLEFDVEDVLLDIDTLIPCGLIINELVTNSLKYGFKERDSLEINIGLTTQSDDVLSLNVADNGPGIPPEIDIRNCTSLGLQIVQSLVTQLQGTLNIERESGTRFNISFPSQRANGTNQFYTL